MTPLDLRLAPPRPPRAELAGIIFLPRSIDKVRASLPGGNRGDYNIEGFTLRLLDALDISLDDFTSAVAAAASDDDTVALVRGRAGEATIEAWKRFLVARPPSGGDRAKALERYPWLVERPDLTLSLDVLEEDDRRAFAQTGA